MSKLTKNKKLALEKIEDGRVYTIEEAAQLVKKLLLPSLMRQLT